VRDRDGWNLDVSGRQAQGGRYLKKKDRGSIFFEVTFGLGLPKYVSGRLSINGSGASIYGQHDKFSIHVMALARLQAPTCSTTTIASPPHHHTPLSHPPPSLPLVVLVRFIVPVVPQKVPPRLTSNLLPTPTDRSPSPACTTSAHRPRQPSFQRLACRTPLLTSQGPYSDPCVSTRILVSRRTPLLFLGILDLFSYVSLSFFCLRPSLLFSAFLLLISRWTSNVKHILFDPEPDVAPFIPIHSLLLH